jgi:hypothetical protein
MPTENDPIVGNWYRDVVSDRRFEVVAVDEDEGTVGLQYYDGDVEEVDIDAWYEMDLEGIEAPEDWTGPMVDVEPDDLHYTETDSRGERPDQERRPREEEWARQGRLSDEEPGLEDYGLDQEDEEER